MKRFSAQFKKQSESVHLRNAERDLLRERIVSYMEYHPLPSNLAYKETAVTQGVLTEPFKVFTFNPLYVRSFVGVFAVFVLVSIPALAEKAVPGDILYPVKVQFNEEVRATLAFSPYQKVAWETQRMERRIAEARLLAREGKLTQETQDQVAQAVREHSDAAQREIAQLRESDSDEAAIAEIAFTSALAVQSEVLENHVEGEEVDEGTQGRSVAVLAQAVEEARTSAEASQQGVRLSYEKLLGRIESESTGAYELFISVQNSASEEEVKNIERRLSDIKRKIAKAQEIKEGENERSSSVLSLRTQTDAGTSTQESTVDESTQEAALSSEEEAIELLRATLMDIQKLVNYMTHIDVRRSVSIEELVPLTLTDDEMRTKVLSLLDETIALQNEIGLREIKAPRAEKVTLGQTELESKLSDVVSLLDLGYFEEAYTLLEEAHEIARDLDRLTKDDPLKEVPEVLKETASTTEEVATTTQSVEESE